MTLPEDPEVKAGWGPINLNWLFRGWAEKSIEWHDKVTSKGSAAQQAGISNERVAQAFRDQLDHLASEPRQGLRKMVARVAGGFVAKIQHWFYEGRRERKFRKYSRGDSFETEATDMSNLEFRYYESNDPDHPGRREGK